METQPSNHFDRAKPFYPLVISYMVLLHGFIELASRHAVRHAVEWSEASDRPSDRGSHLYGAGENEVSVDRLIEFYQAPENRHVTPLLMPLQLRSEAQDNHIDIGADELATEVFENGPYLAPWTLNAAGILLISAYEETKASSDGGPLWEFLRHSRNAAGHGSRFNFGGSEPKRPAVWGTFTLTRSMRGTPLFKGNGGLLSPGDPIKLLWDIEQAYPDLRVRIL